MQKGYNIKIYELDGTFERVLSPSVVMSRVSFSESVNGGQWELNLKLNLPFNTTQIWYNNIVRVYVTDENNAPRLIYSGIVGNIKRVIENNWEYLDVDVVGLASILSMFYFYEWWYHINKNQPADEILEDIIDYFDTKYPSLLSYTAWSIETASTIHIDFTHDKCLDAIKDVVWLLPDFWWTIWPDWVLHFHPKVGGSWQVVHRLTMWNNIDKITVEENAERIVNKYILKYTWSEYTAEDVTSQTANWLRELYEDKSEFIKNLGTATIAGDEYIEKHKNYSRKISIVINEKYDIESIRAWHFVTVQNIDYSISTLQVLKLQYNIDKLTVELEDTTSFASEVFL